ncbi:PQQ-binding-like beta-propeller repeat protein (plasmid) [Haladaptatus sp. SPP-AMP-3]|uniref:outer membrane protein assembly factor BamB family protein n=1 Tax=Haladaptatus sp. SPP-AMP-3 TaxID=3121295 RepID=UPI003C2B2328
MSGEFSPRTGTDRRTFLKTVGITMGVASYGSTVSVAGDGTGGRENRWNGPRSGPGRAGATGGSGPAPFPTLDWKMDLDGGMYRVEPVIADGVVYLAATTNNTPGERSGYLGAYDIETGDRRWKRTNIFSPKTPATDGERLYFSTHTSEEADGDGLYALDAESGATTWKRTDHDVWSPPVVAGDRLFTSNRDGTYAFDRENGEIVWKTDGVSGLAKDVGDALSYAAETVFVSDGNALDAADGSVKWRAPPDDATLGTPATNGEMVYYTQTDYVAADDTTVRIEARSPDTGEVEWTYESEGDNRWDGRPAITDGHVFLVDLDAESTLRALDADSGETAWETELQGRFLSSPVVGDETVYLGSRYAPKSNPAAGSGLVHAVDSATGDRRWSCLLDNDGLETSPEDAPAAGEPVVADGKLYAATYPANATLDYKYTYYSNFFVLGSCDRRPDGDERLPSDGPDGGDDFPPLDACIDVVSNLDLDSVDAGDIVRLVASCSTDRELEFVWDIGGDGRYEESGSVVSVTVPTCGSLTVVLKVTDANGATDTATVRLSTN